MKTQENYDIRSHEVQEALLIFMALFVQILCAFYKDEICWICFMSGAFDTPDSLCHVMCQRFIIFRNIFAYLHEICSYILGIWKLHCLLSRPSVLSTISFPSSRRHCTVGSGTPTAVHIICVEPPSFVMPSSKVALFKSGSFKISGDTTTSK